MTTITIDDLHFELRRSERRKTVQITVDRGGELVLFAPTGCPDGIINDFVREKRYWIFTKLAEKEALRVDVPPKQFVNGEGFPYLGRSYRLLLVDDQDVPVKLERGRFQMRRDAADDGRKHLIDWYTEHARIWLTRRVGRLKGRVGAEPSGVTVQDLSYRWGSCGKGGRLYFHWRTILLPSPIAEYVVAHELVHLHEPHHTPAFWTRLQRAVPDFASRKQWLAENAAGATEI